MNKIIKKLIILVLLLNTQNIFTATHINPQWNLLIYMDGMEELYPAAIKNITDAMSGYAGTNAQVFIQVHADSETNIAYRYHLSIGKLVFDNTITLTSDPVQNIIDGARWAFKKNTDRYNGFIFWNHGAGILDPTWQKIGTQEKFGWLSEPDGALTRSREHALHRGILLDNVAKTYLNNQQMVQALTGIKEQVLNNRKIDFLGTDTCGMAMLEVAWQVRDYADYFIGAQNCALKDGWPYREIMAHISSTPHTPIQAVQMIIGEYSNYYKKTGAGGYTQAALDLSKIEQVKNNLDQVLNLLSNIYDIEKIKTITYNARQKCPVFCIHPTYTDLWTWYDELSQELINGSDSDQQIKKLLQDGKNLIENAVVAYTTGNLMQQAHGISIYFPYHHVDSSYFKTQFANDSMWAQFISKIIS